MATRLDSRQTRNRAALPNVGSAANEGLDQILEKIDSGIGSGSGNSAYLQTQIDSNDTDISNLQTDINPPLKLKQNGVSGVKEVTQLVCLGDVGGSLDGTYFLLQDDSGSVGVWIDVDDSGTSAPAGALAADRQLEITTITTNMTAAQVGGALYTAITADSKFEAGANEGNGVIRIQDASAGARTNASDGDTGFTITEYTAGVTEALDRVIAIEAIRKSLADGTNTTIQPIEGLIPTFTSGTVTFPAASGSNITFSAGDAVALTMADDKYKKVIISIDEAGDLYAALGNDQDTAADALGETLEEEAGRAIGEFLLQTVGSVVQNVTNDNIYQYNGGGAGGGGGADFGPSERWSQEGFQPIVKDAEYTIPYGSFTNIDAIDNRAPIRDAANTMKPLLGVERIGTYTVIPLNDEFGPNGELVYKLKDNEDERVRFIGEWESSTGASGTRVSTSNQDDSVHITFYGTGLNMLATVNATNRDFRATIDNGSEGSDFYGGAASAILDGRNYRSNTILPVTSGLTLGWHTVKIRNAGATDMSVHGFEILNELTQLKTLPGTAYNGISEEVLSSADDSNYDAGITGTKGARVVKYIKDGAISQAVEECATSPSYLTSTDHSDEEVLRKFNYREFGVNTSDDFSTLAGSTVDKSFTLNDGTTNLVANDVEAVSWGGLDVMGLVGGTSSFITLTFTGTGLALFMQDGGSVGGTYSPSDVWIDGTSVGQIPGGSATLKGRYVDICSGLPYQTHTVKIKRNTNTGIDRSIGVIDFVVYQPKKPTLPAGAVELADYNVLADFSANSTNSELTISQGVLRKDNMRELLFEGSGWSIALSVTNIIGGHYTLSSTNGDKFKYTFFGTGFDLRFLGDSSKSNNVSAVLNGSALTSTNYPSASFSTYGAGIGYTASTGVLDMQGSSSGEGCGFVCSGLALGVYTVEFTNNTTNQIIVDAIDIITPIHINDPSFKLGSLSLSDTRKFVTIPKENVKADPGVDKAYIKFDGTVNEILNSYNISSVLDVGTGEYIVYFDKPFKSEDFIVKATAFNSSIFVAAYDHDQDQRSGIHSITLRVFSDNGGAVDAKISAGFAGELQDEE